MTTEVCEHDRLKRSCDVCLLTADLAEANTEIRRLRLRLAMLTGKVTPFEVIDPETGDMFYINSAASLTEERLENLKESGKVIRLGDGIPETI